jgi:lipopolysaccharide/colanic/teichoic acid biosynthesis glycosyltransferase
VEVPSHLADACPPSVTRRNGWHERVFDLVIATGVAIAFLPLIACLAVMVRLDSRGPAFFRQERLGRDGIPFWIWKFRSMHHNNDDQRHRAESSAWFAAKPTVNGYKTLADPRITRMGRLLRKTSLDELPQLFNVLRGEMSLVGPRPGIPYELDHYQPWYFERQRVKPGMTGLWQVSGRERMSAVDMMTLDIRYVRERSLWLDFQILLLTLPALLGRTKHG